MQRHHEFRSAFRTTLANVAALGLVLSAALAAPAPAVVGDWQGTIVTSSGTLRVVLHFEQSKESLKGTLDSPDQGVTGFAIDTVTFQQPDLHFEIARMGSSYDGKLSQDNSEITGQWKQGGGSMSITFKRAK